jgi:hypothetical protein
MQRDKLKERFGLSKLAKNNSEDLLATLYQQGMIVLPHPYRVQGTTLRIYDVESEIGKIALAVDNPQDVPDTALKFAVELQKRAIDGKNRRSDDVQWLCAFDVFLQIVIRRPPEGWEILDDDCELHQLEAELAKILDLPDEIVHANETVRIAGSVCACRPRVSRWTGGPPAIAASLEEALTKQRDIFDGVLRAAANHLLRKADIPSRKVKLGLLGLRYRREIQGDI